MAAVNDAVSVRGPDRFDAERVVLRDLPDVRAVEVAHEDFADRAVCSGGEHDLRTADAGDAEYLVQYRINRRVRGGVHFPAVRDAESV